MSHSLSTVELDTLLPFARDTDKSVAITTLSLIILALILELVALFKLTKRQPTAINVLLINTLAGDCIVCVSTIIMTINALRAGGYRGGVAPCLIANFISTSFCLVVVISFIFLSIFRNQTMRHTSLPCTVKAAYYVVAAIWTLSIPFGLLPHITHDYDAIRIVPSYTS
ncbi:hypothetical protein HDU91_001994, partial [Kappamyces sp. JEL0680]